MAKPNSERTYRANLFCTPATRNRFNTMKSHPAAVGDGKPLTTDEALQMLLDNFFEKDKYIKELEAEIKLLEEQVESLHTELAGV